MKNKFLLLTALLILASCASQQDDALTIIERQSNTTVNRKRTIADAIEIAKYASSLLPTASRDGITVDENSVIAICAPTRSRSDEVDTLLYAVNNENEKGFTLVAAPQNVEPIIAITEDGSFESDATLSNINFQFALDIAKEYVSKKSVSLDTMKLAPEYEGYKDNLQKQRISVQWGQKWPQNIYCSNGVAGCVPVAIGQICTYFAQPTSISLNFEGKDQDTQILDWDQIKRHTNYESKDLFKSKAKIIQFDVKVPCTAEDSTHYAIGRFVRQIGENAHSKYVDIAPDSIFTSTTEYNGISTLKALLTNHTFSNCFNLCSVLYENLKNDGIAIFFGNQKLSDDKIIGHSWVADATGYVQHYLYDYEIGADGSKTRIETLESTKHYIHYNWGWNGNCNGYFLVDVFDTTNAYDYDTETNTVNYNFNNYISFLYIE
jgi:hypothetical protein